MNYLKNHPQKIVLAVLILFLIGIFWRFSTLLYFPDAGEFLKKEEMVKVHPGETVQEKFIAAQDDLAEVQMILRSPGIEPGDKAAAKILDENCEKALRTGFLQDSFLDSNNLYNFSFAPLPASRSRTFCLEVTFRPQKSTAKSLRFFYRNEPGKSFQNLTIGETFPDKTLSTRLAYKGNIWQSLTRLDQRISQYKPSLLKGAPLAFIAGGFLVLSIFFLIVLIFL